MAKIAKDNTNKVQIKPTGGKNQDAIWVFPVDAKEIVASGSHEYVGTDLGKADWLKGDQPKPAAKKAAKPAASGEDDGDDGEGDEITEDTINGMNTKTIDKFVKDKELTIEGYDDLNLAKKREAVNAAYFEEDDGDL